MKHKFLFSLRAITMLLVMCLSIGNVWGKDPTVSIVFSSGTSSGTTYYFQDVSGDVSNVLSFSSAKNSSTTDPSYNSTSGLLRLYYNSQGKGGSITLSAATGVTIKGFVLTVATTPTTKYTADNGTATAVTYSSKVATVSNLSCSTLKIQNCNTTNTKLDIKSIVVTYTAGASTYTVDYNYDGGTKGTSNPTEGTIGTAFAVSAPTKTDYTFDGWTVTSSDYSNAYWGTSSSSTPNTISSSSTKCQNGATGDVYFKDLDVTNKTVTLTATWKSACTKPVTISKSSEALPTGCSFELSKTSGCGDGDGESVLVTCTPADHYTVKAVSSTSGSAGTISEDKCTVSGIKADATINVEFEKDPTYAITFTDGVHSTSVDSKSVYKNETFTFPKIDDETAKTTGTCQETHYHFMGWVKSGDALTDANIKKANTTSDAVTGDANYLAVWAEGEEGESGKKEYSWTFANSSWTTSGTESYFSSQYGMKKVDAYVQKCDIQDFKDYAGSATEIKIGVKSFQNGGTSTILTVDLLDKDGNVLGTGKTITPANGSGASDAAYQYVTFDATNGAAGYRIKCTTYGKGTLVNASSYSISYKEVEYNNYITKCCTPLDAPGGLALTSATANSITFGWNEVTNATGYQYKIGDGAWSDTQVARTATVGELSAGQTISIQVRAIYSGSDDYCSEGVASTAVNMTTYYTITASVNDVDYGSASVSLDNSNWYSSVAAASGTTIYVKATNYDGYSFSSWSINDGGAGSFTSATTAATTFTTGAANTTIKATFMPVTKTLDYITITHAPNKVDYLEGEFFNPAGLVITATYVGGLSETVTPTSYNPTLTTALTPSDKKVSISYNLGEVTKTKDQEITVTPVYTVQWLVNGQNHKTISNVAEGTVYSTLALPDNPSDNAMPNCATKFMGWATAEVSEEGVEENAVPWVNTSSTIAGDNKTFYAVFASLTEGDASITIDKNKSTEMGSGYSSNNFTIDGITFSRSYFGIQGTVLQWKGGTNYHFTSNTAFPGVITRIQSSTAGDGSVQVYASASSTFSSSANTTITSSNAADLSFQTTDNIKYVKFKNETSGFATVSSITITYKSQVYSKYVTNCCTPLNAPANAEASNVKSTTATISWSAVTSPAAASGYKYSLDGVNWTSTTNTSVDLTDLTVETAYTAQVRATYSGDDYCAEGKVSEINFTTLAISETPSFNPASMTFVSPKSITIAAAAGASIYYTTDGTAPTTSSTKYTAAIEVSATTTIKAIAVEEGKDVSAVAEATYTKSNVKLDPQLAFTAAPESTVWGTDVTFTAASTLSAGAVTYSIKESNTGASINAEGLLTTTKAGSLTVVATIAEAGDYAAQTKEATITVNKKTPIVSFEKSAYTGYVEVDFASPTASVTEGYDGALAYTSNATGVATVVEGTGVVSIKAKGSAEITATAPATDNWESANKKYTLTVYKPATAISLSAVKINLAVGASQTIIATLNPSDADQEAIIWSSDKTSVATVNASTGQVTAVAAGKANITAKSKVDESVSATCIVKVAAPATYTKVTSENDLAEGDIIVLADVIENTPYVASTISDGSFGYVIGSYSNPTLTVSGANELTLGKDANGWTITSAQGAVGFDYDNAHSVVASSSNDYVYSWAFADHYQFTLGSYTVGKDYEDYKQWYNLYYIKCNTTSHLFTTYLSGSESGTHAVNIFKKNVVSYSIILSQPTSHAVIAASASSAKEGAEITLSTSSIDDGYEITAWSVVDEDGMPVAVTNGKFNMPASPVIVSATVGAINYDVVVMGTDPADKATVTVNGESGLSNKHIGDEITVAYTNLHEDYEFTSWDVEGDDGAVSVTDGKFTMPASDVAVTLNVKEKTYTVSAATGIVNGSVAWEGTTDNKAPRHATITLSNEPAKGYALSSYSVYKTGEPATIVEVIEGMFEMPNYNVTVSATFEKLPCTVLTTPVVTPTTTYRTVTLNWPAVANADYYEVYVMDGTTEKYGEQITETSVTVAKLAASHNYKYEVQAFSNNTTDYCESEIASAEFTTDANPTPALPVITPNGGTDLTSAQTVAITASDPILTLEEIYYNLDGTSKGSVYSEAFTFNKDTTLKAKALYTDADGNQFLSEMVTANFTFIKPDVPTASIEEGQCYVGDQLTISGAEGCTIRYRVKIGEAEWGTVQESTTSATYTFAAEGTYKVQAQLQLNGIASDYWVKTYTAVIKPKTVTLSMNGNTDTKLTETTAGEGVDLPATEPNPCTNGDVWAFVGWSESEVTTTTTAPTNLVSGLYKPSADRTLYAVYKKIASGTMHLDEDFSSATSGNNTATDGSSTLWTLSNNFSAGSAYQAGGAVKLGGKNSTGSLTTKTIIADAGNTVTVAFDVKGWSSVEGDIVLSVTDCENQSITYTQTISGSFEHKSTTFILVSANPQITIATSAKRAFIDNLQIFEGTVTYNYTTSPVCAEPRVVSFDVQGGVAIDPIYVPAGTAQVINMPTAQKDNCFFQNWTLGGVEYTAPTYTMTKDGVSVEFVAVFSEPVTEVAIVKGQPKNASAVLPLNYSGTLTVQDGAILTMDETNTVGTLIIETKQGSSGQIVNAEKLTITGEAKMEYALAVTGETAANQWHNFAVPFPVDALSGVYGYKNDSWVKLTNEVDYAIEDYHGDIRANGQYGWKKFRGVMQPGITYSMTVNGDIDKFRFVKATGTFTPEDGPQFSYTAHTGSGESTDKGWNGCGNMKLNYTTIYGTKFNNKVQVLNASDYKYETKTTSEIVFTVGSAFFVQAAWSGTNGFSDAVNASENIYAPARLSALEENTEMKVTLSNNESTDNLYISAGEDALNEYEIGHDLCKMFATMTPKAPMLWTTNYKGTKLSSEYAPLINDEATYELSLYAPKAGEYTLAATAIQGATLYLYENGSLIWNLSQGAYTLDLSNGTNTDYTLVLKADGRGIGTGAAEIDADNDGVQKFILDERLIIIRDGKMYNAEGALVK